MVAHSEPSLAHDSTSEAGPATGNLGLYAGDVQYIQAPTFWSHSDIELGMDAKDEWGEELFRLTDIRANVSILGSIIEVSENVKRMRTVARNHSSDGGEHRANLAVGESLPSPLLHTFLTKWSGAQSRVWSYTAECRMLAIRLEAEEREGNLHIVVSDTEYIELPTIWWNSQIRFSVERDDLYGRELIVLFDQQSNVRIVGSRVDARENVEPLMKFIWPREYVERIITWTKGT